jgi:voltage-gated potassium channel
LYFYQKQPNHMINSLRQKIFDIIFEADTRPGKYFDLSILAIILLSVAIVILESVPEYRLNYGRLFIQLEWTFTIIFLLEYLLRIAVTPNRIAYIFSFFGIIDLLAILPAFLALVFTGAHSLLIIRAIRLLRVFRILKVTRYSKAGLQLAKAISSSRAKIGVFLFAVLIVVILVGTLMYIIEGEENGYTSIPKSIYWAVVTLTTVGYGDLTPHTPLGQFLSSLVMIMGYAIIAVPTGIISVELARAQVTTQVCTNCMCDDHDSDALFCKRCGEKLN